MLGPAIRFLRPVLYGGYMNSLNIKKNDQVIVLSGKERGKKGKVLRTIPDKSRVIIEGVNLVTRHRKPRKQGDAGGLIQQEAAINACKVMRICPKCSQPTRTGYQILANGSKTRICKKCGETI